jgi:hypothetical protein
VQGCMLCRIILVEIHNSVLELRIVYHEVLVALMQFSECLFGSIHMVGVSVCFFKQGYKGFEVSKVYMVIFHEVD